MSTEVPLDTYQPAALEQFIADLIAAGFERQPDSGQRSWTRPLPSCFNGLTDATDLTLEIDDGWPVRLPPIIVKGLSVEHADRRGAVCLWPEDTLEISWLRWADIERRLEQWCDAARAAVWRPQDFALDAWTYFENISSTIVTIDLPAIQPQLRDQTSGPLRATVDSDVRWNITSGAPTGQQLKATWYARVHLDRPPQTLAELRAALTTNQRTNLDRNLARRSDARLGEPSGGLDLAVLTWHREHGQDAIAVAFAGAGETLSATAMRVTPVDHASLRLRAGPDASGLSDQTVVVIGNGAIGSHVALLLAQSGVGRLRLSDSDIVLPVNAVRHIAGASLAGHDKPRVVKHLIGDHAPWCRVQLHPAVSGPVDIRTLAADADLVIDTTGQTRLSLHLPQVLADIDMPLLSVALYRGGAVARIRRQAHPSDTELALRASDPRYPHIPPGEGDSPAGLELGCSSIVHNAPPAAVSAAAAATVQEAIAVLLDRMQTADEILYVYNPIEPPLDTIGRHIAP